MEERDTTHMNSSSNGHAVSDASLGAFYERNSRMSYILKKTEKITTAIYMVTDFMIDSEPLKKELRTYAILLLSKTRELSKKATEPDYSIVEDLKFGSESISSLINLATTIGLVSNMNGGIIVKELEKTSKELIQIYNDRRVSVTTHPGYANIILSEEMFQVSVPEIQAPVRIDKGQDYNGQEKSNTVLYKKPETEIAKKENVSKSNTLGIKIARRNDVLNIVKVKGQVSVKDIVLMLKDISEKTVQRELFSLVKEGVLKKEGEKRWSVYKLT
jgi:hypothetical protein